MALRAEGETIGSLAAISRSATGGFPEGVQDALEALARRAGPALFNALRFTEARELAELDSLTGLHNRRLFYEFLAREIARARRYERYVSVIVFDLDDFKRINDRIGHLGGDTVLVEVADAVRSAVRVTDIPCRVGGDEFAVILPESAATMPNCSQTGSRSRSARRRSRRSGRSASRRAWRSFAARTPRPTCSSAPTTPCSAPRAPARHGSWRAELNRALRSWTVGAWALVATLALAGASHGAPGTAHLNIGTPGECEAGVELDGPPRFFCDLISFTQAGGWALVPSNTMLVAAPARPGAASSFTVTTGMREFGSFAAFAAAEIPIAKQLVHPGSTTVFVDRATLPAGAAFTVTVHLPDGVVHELVGVLYKKTPYLISTVATTDADQLALQQMIESADFEHPAGVSTHLVVSMDWTTRLPLPAVSARSRSPRGTSRSASAAGRPS